MKTHYIIAIIMAVVSSSMLLLLLSMLLNKKIDLNETLKKYYFIEHLESQNDNSYGWSQQWGSTLLMTFYKYLSALKLYNSTLDSDLAITGKSIASVSVAMFRNILMSSIACLFGFVLIQSGDLKINAVMAIVLSIMIVIGLGILPILKLKQEASMVRENNQTIISAYLDLVSICLAGGMGLEESLTTNATIGNSIVMEKLRSQFAISSQLNDPLWNAFLNVSFDLNIPLLKEIASVFKISGTEGAKIKASISRKAQSLREKRLINEESKANSVTERLFLPSVLLLLGFLIFVGYPAIEKIFIGL